MSLMPMDRKGLDELIRDLKKLSKKAVPYASRSMLNVTAFEVMRDAREVIGREMTLRNRWTAGSVRVTTTKTLNVKQQAARVGSFEKYMADQEWGSVEKSGGKHGVAIPTGYSAGQESQRPRTRLPRRANRLSNIRLKARKGANRAQKNLIAVKDAAASGSKYVFLSMGRTKGIFKVIGGKKRPRVKMVQDLSKRIVRINPNPWLGPPVDRATRRMGEHYRDALLFQIEKQKLFRKKR